MKDVNFHGKIQCSQIAHNIQSTHNIKVHTIYKVHTTYKVHRIYKVHTTYKVHTMVFQTAGISGPHHYSVPNTYPKKQNLTSMSVNCSDYFNPRNSSQFARTLPRN